MSIIKKVRDAVAHERESHRMGQEHLRQVKAQAPELYVKGFWRKTPAQARAEVKAKKK